MLNKATFPRLNNDFATVPLTHKELGFGDKVKFVAMGVLGKKSVFLNALGLLLGRAVIFGDLTPFALAFYVVIRAASPSRSVFLAFWISVGMWFSHGLMVTGQFLMAALLVTAIEKAISIKAHSKAWRWPVLAGLVSLGLNIPWIMLPLNTHQLMLIGIEGALVAILVVIFFGCSGFILNPSAQRTLASEEIVCLCILMALAMTGLSGLSLGALSIKGMVAKFLVLFAAYVGGCHFAATMGVTTALVTYISQGLLLPQVGLYAFAGMLAGLFKDFKKIGVIVGFALGYGLLSFYYLGSTTLQLGMLETGAAGLALLILGKNLNGALDNIVPGSLTIMDKQSNYGGRLHKIARRRLTEFAGIFNKLKESFAEDANISPFEEENLANLLQELSCRVCEKCARRMRCWDDELYATYHALYSAVALVDHNGNILSSEMPALFKERCLHLDKFTDALNSLSEMYRLNQYWQKRLYDSKQLVATQLEGVSRIITDLTQEFSIDFNCVPELETKIATELTSLNIHLKDVQVTQYHSGKIVIKMDKNSCNNETQCTATIIPVVSGLLGKQLSRGGGRCAAMCNKEKCHLFLSTAQTYQVTWGVASLNAGDDSVSGDSYTFLELPNGKIAAMLSDGMGRGSKAKKESATTISILENLLQTGFSKDTAVRTINAVLALRSPEETFATMDLALIDLYTGKGEFVKIGASTSYCKRGNSIQMLPSSSLPIGILQDVVPDEHKLQLVAGDLVVMVSDGVLEGLYEINDKEKWLGRIIEQVVSDEPQDVANYILERARVNCRPELFDDMTVLVMGFDKRQDDFRHTA